MPMPAALADVAAGFLELVIYRQSRAAMIPARWPGIDVPGHSRPPGQPRPGHPPPPRPARPIGPRPAGRWHRPSGIGIGPRPGPMWRRKPPPDVRPVTAPSRPRRAALDGCPAGRLAARSGATPARRIPGPPMPPIRAHRPPAPYPGPRQGPSP